MKVKRPLWEERNMFGARIKIMWEEQLVDPQIHHIIKIKWKGLCEKKGICLVPVNVVKMQKQLYIVVLLCLTKHMQMHRYTQIESPFSHPRFWDSNSIKITTICWDLNHLLQSLKARVQTMSYTNSHVINIFIFLFTNFKLMSLPWKKFDSVKS